MGDEGAKAPSLLTWAWRTKRYGSPYGANVGWLDWPAGIADKMTQLSNIYDVFSDYRSFSGNLAKWADANPSRFAIIAKVEKLRMELNAN